MKNPTQNHDQLVHDLENMLSYCLQIFRNDDAAAKQALANGLPADLFWSVSIQCSLHCSKK